ncbi:haloacid dehalogenase-like hydrolase [Plantactinospora mayteni]|uniref:Haloacid dehalogenase n=1 Tax=Plantactinospora mayteni TaxID=566021 RepID=A0ABQ4EKX5_9ACTN|nr:HAD family hydrolase [Plantactinospora mayteni]GIG95406.1 haloacid dehalogenase [Plantactinospora mayteni]
MANNPTLILWDVDHTLVDISGVSREIYESAFAAVFGRRLEKLADMTGRTEQAILADTLALHDIAASSSVVSDLYSALGEAAERLQSRMLAVGRPLPGARAAVSALADADLVQTLVTGNLATIARVKLKVFGLDEHIDFEVGGYGSDGDIRSQLVLCALARATKKYGIPFLANGAIVIGDTPLDILAAREVGARAIGVATGKSSISELNEAGADAVLEDLTDIEKLRASVYNR